MKTCLQILLTVVALAAPALSLNSPAADTFPFNSGLEKWGFECQENQCVKVPLNGRNMGKGQTVCRMLCGEDIGTLWPKPTGTVLRGNYTIDIDQNKIKFRTPLNSKTEKLWKMVEETFLKQIGNKIPKTSLPSSIGKRLNIRIRLEDAAPEEMPKLTYETDESYSLRIIEDDDRVFVDIRGKTFFGARHGVETLSQLIVYDEVGKGIRILADTEITDAPAYKHRGVILDTGRNYFSVESIKRTINGMAMSKLNVLHWHLTDATSFPLVVPSRPNLHNRGAYSEDKVYTRADIADVLEYALSRGVRVIPEFDAPAHVGEGWQGTNLVTCFNAQPWRNFCLQPPCGQFDPTNDALYDVLEDIYREIFEAFDPDVFHMGSDTVSFNCWNSSETIRSWMLARGWKLDIDGFIRLWGYFQNKAMATVDKVAGKRNVSIILHANPLSDREYIDEFIDKSRHIVQLFDKSFGSRTAALLSRGIRVLASHTDLFVDGETSQWLGGWDDIGGWQKFYNARPEILTSGPNTLTLGSEVGAYSEQIDEFSLDTLLWPKASALGERLWTNPDHGWQKASSRLDMHRTHLTKNGLRAAALQPEWCSLNKNDCPKYRHGV